MPKALLPYRYCQEEIRAGLWLSFCLSLCTWFSWGSWHRFPAHHVSASACPSLSTHPGAWCLIPVRSFCTENATVFHPDGWESMLSRGIAMPIHSFPPAKVNSVPLLSLDIFSFLCAPSNNLLGLVFFFLNPWQLSLIKSQFPRWFPSSVAD